MQHAARLIRSWQLSPVVGGPSDIQTPLPPQVNVPARG
jgi:hypothetical protein